ncbi:MAG: YhbY family RNA-binding protein [Pigmentiphaga sp.]|uniref:YhbY family RNA-binding protein n=1 Tax=Pigmentiphaga sp. TaxID=1977564 RepID=UPI00299FE13A|nr:YhbY family RNA-binding protein [Pigmentiphaga sp.]MDX3904318.1 YhbY family RNA-binding protein [Pigmentiphaga sp.]
MPVLDIPSPLRSALRAAAHPLKPVVLIGDKGLSDAVLQEIDRNLTAHGLIKVRAGGEDRAARDELLYKICDELGCAPVHHLGKIFILYRPTERDPDAALLLGAGKAKSGLAALGTAPRKANEPHLPKKMAVVGKSAPARARADRPERERTARDAGPMTPRERYLGIEGKRQRPSTHEETGSRRGAARTTPPRRPSGLSSTLGAAGKSAGRPAAKRSGSALSLRAGAREGGRSASGGQRTTATSRKPRTATKK